MFEKGNKICRFGFPLPPLHKTMILQGLKKNSNEFLEAQKNYLKIETLLDEMKLGTELPVKFDDFLISLDLTLTDYITALRSSVKEGQCKVFFKEKYIRNKSQ